MRIHENPPGCSMCFQRNKLLSAMLKCCGGLVAGSLCWGAFEWICEVQGAALRFDVLHFWLVLWNINFYVRKIWEKWWYTNLVGALEHQFYFPRNIGNFIIPIDEQKYFSEGWPNHQPDMLVERHPILLRPWCYLMLDVDDMSCAFIRICNHWAWESHKPSAQLGQRCCLNIWYLLIEVHDVHGLSSSFLLDDLDDLDGYLMVIVLPVYTIWRHSHME